MITTVLMKRSIMDGEISQNSKTGFFSATDLFRVGNEWRMKNGLYPIKIIDFLKQKNVKEFIKTLEMETGGIVKISGRGRGIHTWVHPFLFIDMALAINPKLKIKVYSWLYDELIKYRNKSGDSYKKMAGSLYININNKSDFKLTLIEYATRIKEFCNVDNWESASEEQLKLRDKIHEYVSIFSDIIREKENLLDISMNKAKKEIIG